MKPLNVKQCVQNRWDELSEGERKYAQAIVPIFLSWTVYMFLGIPLIMP